MNKIEKLIRELCPHGIMYKKIEEIASVERGKRLVKKQLFKEEKYPVYQNSMIPLGYYKEYNYSENTVFVIGAGAAGEIGYSTNKFWAADDCYPVICDDDIDSKYLYHVLLWMQPQIKGKVRKASIPRLSRKSIERIKVPVPPLEVQREIIRVLDSFTLLTAELTAELTARKKQYEFYRDKLLTKKTNIPIVKLEDIATDFYRGSGIKRDEIVKDGVPCVRYGEIYTSYNICFDKCISHTKLEYIQSPKYFEYGDILFVITGESVEDIAKSIAYVGNEKCLAGSDIVVMKHNQNPRYLAHVLATTEARKQKSKGKVKSKVVHASVPSIKEIEIPLPPLDVQERYANVLDNFEKICTDLNIGLPAEIEARQKQYEYYRDMLLTFAETGNMIKTDRQTDRAERN